MSVGKDTERQLQKIFQNVTVLDFHLTCYARCFIVPTCCMSEGHCPADNNNLKSLSLQMKDNQYTRGISLV